MGAGLKTGRELWPQNWQACSTKVEQEVVSGSCGIRSGSFVVQMQGGMWRNDVCDVAVPCGFARPGWEVHLCESVPLGEGKTVV